MGSNTRASNNRINTNIPKLDPSKADILHTYTFHCDGTTPSSAVVALGVMMMIICSTQLRISVIIHDINNNNNDTR